MASKTFNANYSGSWDSSDYVKLYLDIETVARSVANNTTTENCKLYAIVQYAGGSYNSSSKATIEVDDGSTSKTVSFDYRSAGTKTLISSWNKVVTHDDDGSATVDVKATHVSGVSIGTATITGTYTCDVIDRETNLPDVTGDVGEEAELIIEPANSDFTHTLSYTFGSLNATLFTKTSLTDLSFTIPTSFYAQMPNDPSKEGTLTLTTYNGNTSIGTDTSKLTVNTVENDCKPVISGLNVIDTNTITIALTGNENKIVKGYSTAYVSGTASPRNSASIESVLINGSLATLNANNTFNKTISNASGASYTVLALDSRKYPTNDTASATGGIVDYFNMTMSAIVERPSQTGTEMAILFSGKSFNDSFGDVTNTKILKWSVREGTSGNYTLGGTFTLDTDYTNGDTTYWSGTGTTASEILLTNPLTNTRDDLDSGDWDYQKIYSFYIEFSDKLYIGFPITPTVSKGIPVWNAYERDDENYFNVNGYILESGERLLKKSNLYLEGDVIITNENINPSNIYSGTWELIDKGFKSKSTEIVPIINTTNTTSSYTACVWRDSSIRIRIYIVNKVDIGDTTLELATLNAEDFGLADWQWATYMAGVSDGGGGVIMGALTTDGVLESRDAYDGLPAGNSTYYQLNYQGTFENMLDSWCDKFYWKKTA